MSNIEKPSCPRCNSERLVIFRNTERIKCWNCENEFVLEVFERWVLFWEGYQFTRKMIRKV